MTLRYGQVTKENLPQTKDGELRIEPLFVQIQSHCQVFPRSVLFFPLRSSTRYGRECRSYISSFLRVRLPWFLPRPHSFSIPYPGMEHWNLLLHYLGVGRLPPGVR